MAKHYYIIKKNFEEFKLKNKNIIFEQEKASTHISGANKILANALLEKNTGYYAHQIPLT